MIKLQDLPDEILHEIFKNLSSDGLAVVPKVCERWEEIIRNSSCFMRRLNVILPDMKEILELNLPVKNLTFKDGVKPDCMTVDEFENFILSISKTLEVLSFDKIPQVDKEFFQFFSNFKHLRKLKYTANPTIHREGLVFDSFKKIQSLESVEYVNHQWSGSESAIRSLFNLLEAVPNIKHVTLDGTATHLFFEARSYNFELHRLDAFIVNNWWSAPENPPRVDFFTSQMGQLKHLKLGKLPYDFDGGNVLKFLIEEMKLESFEYGSILLIKDGKKNEKVEEVWFNEVTIKSGMELMRQFSGIRKLEVFLCKTAIKKSRTDAILNPPTDIFENLKEIKVTDHSGSEDLLNFFTGLYKNCRNIEKLIIDSTSSNFDQVLCDVLPYLRALKEVHLPGVNENENLMEIISEKCENNVICIFGKNINEC